MTTSPGGLPIRPNRLSRRSAALLLAASALITWLGAAPATAQQTPTAPVPGAVTLPPPTTSVAGPGVYGAPVWLPLRHNLDGGDIKLGCTYESHGSQFGYECSGHHNRWAIDFIADAGTPIYAAGPGFATNITGKPGGSGFGNVVRIDHGMGISTVYAHMTMALIPPEGMWVDETTQLGTVGSTGSSSANHLHFEKFALVPPATNPSAAESIDPGPLYACRGQFLVSFPQVGGQSSWFGLPWGSMTVASDGQGCVTAASTTAETADAPEPEPDRDLTSPWTWMIAPVFDLLGAADRLVPKP